MSGLDARELENADLKGENDMLKIKITALENEITALRRKTSIASRGDDGGGNGVVETAKPLDKTGVAKLRAELSTLGATSNPMPGGAAASASASSTPHAPLGVSASLLRFFAKFVRENLKGGLDNSTDCVNKALVLPACRKAKVAFIDLVAGASDGDGRAMVGPAT
eukprot:UC1_evm1s1060